MGGAVKPQFLKASISILVTFEGMSAAVSDEQYWKQALGMVVNEGFVGNTTVASAEQYWNALFCTVVIDDGNVNVSRAVHPSKQ